MKRIAIHLPAYGRRATAAIAYAALHRTREQLHALGFHTTVYTAVSNHSDRRLAESHGHHTLMTDNQWVGKKFDDLLRHILKDPDWEYLMEYGSDNVLDTAWAPLVADLIAQGHRRIALNSFFIYDSAKIEPTLLFHKKAATSNIGRITDRASIEATMRAHNFVFEHRLMRGLDWDSHVRVTRASKTPTHILEHNPPLLVDIKDPGSMHQYQSFRKYPENYPAVDLTGNFPELEPTTTHTQWQPQAKSEATPSASTSPTPQSPTPEPPQPAQPTATTRGKMTPSSSSHAQAAAPSPAAAKSSTRPRKTTTDAAKFSQAEAAGASAPKASSSTDSPEP